MIENTAQAINHALLGQSIVWAFLLVFAGGVLTSIGPCNMSMAPIVIAFVGGTKQPSRSRGFILSLFFTLGSSLTFAILGVLASLVGGVFGPARSILYYIVAAVCILIALNMFGVFKLTLPVADVSAIGRLRGGVLGAFLLGLTVGLAGSQCGTPVLVAILSVVMAKGLIAYGAGLLFAYGLGRGVPIVLAGTFTGILKAMPRLAKVQRGAEVAAGIILLAVAFYFIWAA